MHWVCAKIKAGGLISDSDLMEGIAERLKGHKGIRFTDLANQAQDCGRKTLAALLLDMESNTAEQVSYILYLQSKKPQRVQICKFQSLTPNEQSA